MAEEARPRAFLFADDSSTVAAVVDQIVLRCLTLALVSAFQHVHAHTHVKCSHVIANKLVRIANDKFFFRHTVLCVSLHFSKKSYKKTVTYLPFLLYAIIIIIYHATNAASNRK